MNLLRYNLKHNRKRLRTTTRYILAVSGITYLLLFMILFLIIFPVKPNNDELAYILLNSQIVLNIIGILCFMIANVNEVEKYIDKKVNVNIKLQGVRLIVWEKFKTIVTLICKSLAILIYTYLFIKVGGIANILIIAFCVVSTVISFPSYKKILSIKL